MTEPLLLIDKLGFSWPSEPEPTLLIDKLQLERGSQYLLFGPSGCGKSTLLSLIAGINSPQSGSITLLGQQLSSLKPALRDQLRADHLGYVFQLFNLLPYLSVIDNITLACRFSALRRRRLKQRGCSVEEEARRLLAQMGFPAKRIDQPVSNLSIGQQQRVAVARALIGAPELIIADEPTSALDQDNRDRFIELMLGELSHSDSTLLMVSHDRSLASHFNQQLDLREFNRAALHGVDDVDN